MERLALIRLRERFPPLRRSGFSQAIRSLDRELDIRIGIIPDGWFVEELIEGKSFTCVEVEDRHPLSPEKLWRYCDLWDSLEYFGHCLRLFIFDRYGLNERELDLGELY